jgi:hypothetical protein
MTENKMTDSVIFESMLPAEARQLDRNAIASFLNEYLSTGNIPKVPKLASGTIRLDGRREPIGQSSWKWSELEGKQVGCPFWSVEAWKTFESVASIHPDKKSVAIGQMASGRRFRDRRLQQVHVFPHKAWEEMMAEFVGKWDSSQLEELISRLDSFCVGCVVTYKELQELSDEVFAANPWKMYAGTSIRLVENPAWSELHRNWIAEAGLVAR